MVDEQIEIKEPVENDVIKKCIIPASIMKKLLKQITNNAQVDTLATKRLAEFVEVQAFIIANEAKKLSEHAHRKTITEKDIIMANGYCYRIK